MAGRDVQPTFRGPFLALFRHDATGVRLVAQGDVQHLLGRRHFQVQRQFDLGHETVDIGVGDMAPVLAQMGGDTVGPAFRRLARRAHRVGMGTAAGVPDRRHMVDIDAETHRHARPRLPGLIAGMASSSGGNWSAG